MIHVGEEPDPAKWASLSDDGRIQVGGRSVWLDPPEPVIVAQPNRWGVIEEEFPDVDCIVEADALVTGLLPLPAKVKEFRDRAHRPIDPPRADEAGRRLMALALRFSRVATQVKGVKVAAAPFARTVPLTTPFDPRDVILLAGEQGLDGVRTLPDLAGGFAVTIRPEHADDAIRRIAEILGSVVSSLDRYSDRDASA